MSQQRVKHISEMSLLSETVVRAATLREILQIKLAVSTSHSILTLSQLVLAVTV